MKLTLKYITNNLDQCLRQPPSTTTLYHHPKPIDSHKSNNTSSKHITPKPKKPLTRPAQNPTKNVNKGREEQRGLRALHRNRCDHRCR